MKIAHKIARVAAIPLNVPLHVTLAGADRHVSLACCHVEVETDDGLIGNGFTSITEEDVIAQIVNGVAGPAIIGDDAMAHERIWDKLYWKLMPRGQRRRPVARDRRSRTKLWVARGFQRLKMTVGNEALRNRDRRPLHDLIREDAERVRAVPEAGWLTLPETPGLGFEPDRDAIREIAKLPLSHGNAKG